MKRRVLAASLALTLVAALGITAAIIVPRVAASSAGGPGCVDDGKGFVGLVPGGGGERLNWHGTYIVSLCPGASGPQAGDSNVQRISYPDGTYEQYKIVYSTDDLSAHNGAYCYWDLTIDPSAAGPGYHCPAGSNNTDLKWYIVSSSGTSPYLEPAGSGGWQSRPNGLGLYR